MDLERFLAEDDFSLAADLARAAIEVGRNAEEPDIYLPEERGRYRALALRLYVHSLTALRETAQPPTKAGSKPSAPGDEG